MRYFDQQRNRPVKSRSFKFSFEVLYLRNSDIPQYLIDGVVDLAIVGDNLLVEKGKRYRSDSEIRFSKCKVSVAVPKTLEYNSIQDLAGLRIATSYPNTVNEYFSQFGLTVDIHQISGSVEIAPNIGLADAIVDIVSSGSTLFKNNLKEVEVILKSEAVLAVSPKVSPEIQKHIDTLKFRIQVCFKSSKFKIHIDERSK